MPDKMSKLKTKTPRKAVDNLSQAQSDVLDQFNAMMDRDFPLPELDGIVFRWVYVPSRNKKGWGIWNLVELEGEIGQRVMEHIKDSPIYQANPAMVDGNLFRSGDNVLAWATVEMHNLLKERNTTKAQSQLDNVISEHGSRRTVRRVQLLRPEGQD